MLALTASIAAADEVQLPKLMQFFAQNKASKATFVEKKYIGMLDTPIESSGDLAFTAPDKLVKRTLKPTFESLVLEGDQLTLDQQGRRRLTVSLMDHPEISAFVESIRGTLAGDRLALEKFYKLDLSGSSDEWQLVLTPNQARMIKIIRRIQINGSHGNIKTIHFDQGDGDHAEMLITKTLAE